MPNTIKVPSAEGEVDLQILTVEEIDSLLNDNNPQSRTQIMTHMKLLGRPVTELIRMKVPERKAFILERYAELGVGGAAKAKAKGGTVTQIGKGAAAKAATAAAAAKPKAKAAEPEVEEDDEEVEAGEAGNGPGLIALKGVIEAQEERITELQSLVEAQDEKLDKVLEALSEQMKVMLDAHFIIRSTAPTAAGLTEDDVVEYGNTQGYYGTLLVSEEEGSAAAGNG